MQNNDDAPHSAPDGLSREEASEEAGTVPLASPEVSPFPESPKKNKRGTWERCAEYGCKKKAGHDGAHSETKVKAKAAPKSPPAGPDMFGTSSSFDPAAGEIPIDLLADTAALGQMAAQAIDVLAVIGASAMVGPELGAMMSAPPEAQGNVGTAFKVWIDTAGIQMTPGQMVLAAVALAYGPSAAQVGIAYATRDKTPTDARAGFVSELATEQGRPSSVKQGNGATVETYGPIRAES